MEETLQIAGSSGSDRIVSLQEFPVSSGGLYTLADILTSINKKQSKVTPSVIKKKKQDDPDSVEWKEYQAKRLQALKILKQEKEHRLKEEMKRLGLKTVTPDLRSRLEAQFQYLHEALLPDSGLEEEQEAAAREVGKKKLKKSTSVHWSQDVIEKEKKPKSKSTSKASSKSSSLPSKSKTTLSSKSKLKTVTLKAPLKSNASVTNNGTKKRSTSLTKLSSGKVKSKKSAKAVKDGAIGSQSFENEIHRLENIEAGAKSLLHELSDQFGSLDKSASNPLKDGVFTEQKVNKIKSKVVSSPKLKAPSQVKKPRASSLGRLKGSKGSKPFVQSSGYGKRTDNSKGNSSNSIKKTGKAPLDTKNNAVFKKAAIQHSAISGMKAAMDMKIRRTVTRSKSEITNTPKLKAVPIIGGKMVTGSKPLTARKSKSNVVTAVKMPANTAANNKNKLPTLTTANTNVPAIKATKAKSLDITISPTGNTTVIAELYPVNSKIAAAVDSFMDKVTVKGDPNTKITDATKGKAEIDDGQKNQQSSLYVRPTQKKPPKFPTVDLCNVFPGTNEWDTYWEKFNGQITNYYAEMDEYLKSMNDFTMDLDDYSKELKKIQMGNQAFAIKLGLNPNYKSTPTLTPKVPPSMQFTNTPLEPGLYNINGYIIKSGGGRIPGLRLTTVGDDGFSLELDLAEIDIDPQLITVETEFNVMTLTVPVKTELGRVRIIQIRVPSRSNVNDLSLREIQRSSKKGTKTRILLITGN